MIHKQKRRKKRKKFSKRSETQRKDYAKKLSEMKRKTWSETKQKEGEKEFL